MKIRVSCKQSITEKDAYNMQVLGKFGFVDRFIPYGLFILGEESDTKKEINLRSTNFDLPNNEAVCVVYNTSEYYDILNTENTYTIFEDNDNYYIGGNL
jgi:hypothetical protein